MLHIQTCVHESVLVSVCFIVVKWKKRDVGKKYINKQKKIYVYAKNKKEEKYRVYGSTPYIVLNKINK